MKTVMAAMLGGAVFVAGVLLLGVWLCIGAVQEIKGV